MTTRMVWEGRQVNRRVLSLECFKCRAAPGEQCQTKTGQIASHHHALRWYAAQEAGLVPIIYEAGEPLRRGELIGIPAGETRP
jgi:hypothetical protein